MPKSYLRMLAEEHLARRRQNYEKAKSVFTGLKPLEYKPNVFTPEDIATDKAIAEQRKARILREQQATPSPDEQPSVPPAGPTLTPEQQAQVKAATRVMSPADIAALEAKGANIRPEERQMAVAQQATQAPQTTEPGTIYVPQTGKVISEMDAYGALLQREENEAARAKILPQPYPKDDPSFLGQGRVYDPATNQWKDASARAVSGSAVLGPGYTAGTGARGGIYTATPAATPMNVYAQQRGATNALMQTGIGSTREAQARVKRQQELDQLKLQQSAIGAQAQVGAAQAGQATQQIKVIGDLLTNATTSLTKLQSESATPEAIAEAQKRVTDLQSQYNQLTGQGGGQPATGAQQQQATTNPLQVGTNIAGQATKGSTPTEQDEAAWDEFTKQYEAAGYEMSKLPMNLINWYNHMTGLYGKLPLPKQPKV